MMLLIFMGLMTIVMPSIGLGIFAGMAFYQSLMKLFQPKGCGKSVCLGHGNFQPCGSVYDSGQPNRGKNQILCDYCRGKAGR